MDEQHRKTTRKGGLQACSFCSKRKIRCDCRDPCAACDLRNQECIYTNERNKRDPKKGKKWQILQKDLAILSCTPRSQDTSFTSPLSSEMLAYFVNVFWHNIHPVGPMFIGLEVKDISQKDALLLNAIVAITAKTQMNNDIFHDSIQRTNDPLCQRRSNIGQKQVYQLIERNRKSDEEKALPLRLESTQTFVLTALSELGGGAHDFAFRYSAKASLMVFELDLHKSQSDERQDR